MESGLNAIATIKPASANRNATPWIKRSSSWKLTDIFWLKVNTCGKKMEFYDLFGLKLESIICLWYQTLKRSISTAKTTQENPYT